MDKKFGPALTWEDVAELYKKNTGQTAKTRPMDDVFEAVRKYQGIHYNEKEGTLHKIS